MSQTKVNVGMIDASSIADTKVLQGDGAWVTPSAGGWSHVQTQTASSDTAIDFTTNVGTDAAQLQLHINNMEVGTTDVQCYMLFSDDGGTSWEGGTQYNCTVQSNLVPYQSETLITNAAQFQLSNNTATNQGLGTTNGDEAYCATINIGGGLNSNTFNKFYTFVSSYEQNSSGAVCTCTGGGMFDDNVNNIDGIRIALEGGATIVSGTFTLLKAAIS